MLNQVDSIGEYSVNPVKYAYAENDGERDEACPLVVNGPSNNFDSNLAPARIII